LAIYKFYDVTLSLSFSLVQHKFTRGQHQETVTQIIPLIHQHQTGKLNFHISKFIEI